MRYLVKIFKGEKKVQKKIRIEEKGAQNQENRKLKYHNTHFLLFVPFFFLSCILQPIFEKNKYVFKVFDQLLTFLHFF
jgi:hypothetical protein